MHEKLVSSLLLLSLNWPAEHEAKEEQWKQKTFSESTNVRLLGGIYAKLSFKLFVS